MINVNTLIGLLSGSLVTLIAKELLSQINKRQDFVRELKKATYSRKLEKAENAVAFYYTYVNKIVELKKSFEVIIKAVNEIEESDRDVEILQQNMEKLGMTLSELASDKYSNVNAVHLYFELEDSEKWNENDIEAFLESLSETKSIDNEIKFWTELHDGALAQEDQPKVEFYWGKAVELLPKYVSSLQNVIDSLERHKLAIRSIIKLLKQQMKTY